MKKIFVILAVSGLLASCGNGDTDTKAGGSSTTKKSAAYTAGLELVGKNDCSTCHKVDELVTGPSFRDIANKYAGMPDTIVTHLAHKIRKGGTGVWGESVMSAHPGVSQEDAETMVKYILTLKK